MIKKILKSTLLALLLVAFISMPVLAAYQALVQIVTTTTAYDMLPVLLPMDNELLVTNNYIDADGLDVQVEKSGAPTPRMLADDKTLFASQLAAASTSNFYYTTDNTPADFDVLTGYDGLITITDDDTLELVSDFEIEQSGYIDTDAGADKNLVFKDDAYRTYISAEDEITSGIYQGNPPPTVETVTGGFHDVAQGNHAVNMPAGVVAGDLLIVLFAANTNPVIGWPGGWTELFQTGDGASIRFSAAYRISDGGEGPSITVTTAPNNFSAYTSYRISGYSGVPEAGVAVTGNDVNPNPPNLAPSWGIKHTLWFAIMANDDVATVAGGGYPAGFTDGRNDVGATGGSSCGVGSATLGSLVANVNPGAFTITVAEQWVANTIAVAPVDLEITATGIASGEYTVKTYGVANEPAWATGDVLHFTGADDSNINAGDIGDGNKLWISLWFNLDTAIPDGGSGTDQYLIGKYTDADEFLLVWIEGADGKIYLSHDEVLGAPEEISTVETEWALGWHHILASCSTVAGQRLIVDGGTAVTAGANQTAISLTPDVFCIGARDDGVSVEGFIGEIQNVILGNGDLTSTEEIALYVNAQPLSYVTTLANPGYDGSHDVAISGDNAFLAGYRDDALYVVDVSDPANPSLTATFTDAVLGRLDGIHDIVIDGNYAYVTCINRNSLVIIDISVPAAPSIVSELIDAVKLDYVHALTKEGDYIYAGGFEPGSNYFNVIDVSNPAALSIVGSVMDARLNGARGVQVIGDYAYIVCRNSGKLVVIDISTPASPTIVGSLNLTDAEYGLVYIRISGNYAFITGTATDGRKLFVVDISTPVTPLLVTSVAASGANYIILYEGYAFISNYLGGVTVIDISSPTNPKVVFTLNHPSLDFNCGLVIHKGYLLNAPRDIGDEVLTVLAIPFGGMAPTGANAPTEYWYIDEGTGTAIPSYGSVATEGTADAACTWETATYTTGSTGRLCDFTIEVDDGVLDPDRWGKNLKGASVLDNVNDWILNQNNVMPYMGYYHHTVGGVLHAWYQPNDIVEATNYDGTANADSTDVRIRDVGLTQDNDYWNGALLTITSAGGAAPEGETAVITDFIAADDELQFAALTAAVENTDTYTIDFGTLIDRSYYSLEFDGVNDYVNCGQDASLDLTEAITVEAWCKRVAIDTSATLVARYDHNVADRPAWVLRWANNDFAYFTVADGAGASASANKVLDSADTDWHHFVGTYDKINSKIYVDGVQGTDAAGTFDISIAAIDTLIGAGYNAAPTLVWPFGGYIDEVRIYDRALGLTEIQANYNAGVGSYTPDDTTGLVGWWHLEGESLTTVTDSSGESNTGTITGAVWALGKMARPAGSSGSNDSRITWGVNPADITLLLGSLYSDVVTLPATTEPAQDIMPETPVITLFGMTAPDNMFSPLFDTLADVINLPSVILWVTVSMLFVVGGVVAFYFLTKNGTYSAFVGVFLLAICVVMGTVPWWTIIIGMLLAVYAAIAKSRQVA